MIELGHSHRERTNFEFVTVQNVPIPINCGSMYNYDPLFILFSTDGKFLNHHSGVDASNSGIKNSLAGL